MKVYKVHYDVELQGGDSFYGPMGETRCVIVGPGADARTAINKLCNFVEKSSFGEGRKATAEDVTILGVELVVSNAIR